MKKFIYLFFILTLNLFATNYYVSTASSGSANASSWANKQIYTSFNWSQVIGGDTVYVDGGTDSLTYGTVYLYQKRYASLIVVTKGKDA